MKITLDFIRSRLSKIVITMLLVITASILTTKIEALQVPSDYYQSFTPQYYREPLFLIDKETLRRIEVSCNFKTFPNEVAQLIFEQLQTNPLIVGLKELGIASFDGLNTIIQNITDVIDIKKIYWKGSLKELGQGIIFKGPIVTYTIKNKPYEFNVGNIDITAPFNPNKSTLIPNLIKEMLKHIGKK